MARLQLNAEQAAAKEVADMLKSDPTLAQDKKRLQLIREEARNRYISTIMDTSSMTAAAAPDLNASAEPLF
jgi:beta-lactamase regulating signal transducer with metallopeptidase domain